jgi:hypothetical protein
MMDNAILPLTLKKGGGGGESTNVLRERKKLKNGRNMRDTKGN